MEISPLAEKPAEQNILVNIPRRITAYYAGIPDTHISGQRFAFGTSDHGGLSLKNSFNENHILAITQDICFYSKKQKLCRNLNGTASQIKHEDFASEEIKLMLTNAPKKNESIGGIKVSTENGWFAARPSGTEDIYKIYAESFLSKDYLKKIIDEAQTIIDAAL